jgi:FkbM family methyltransferase
LNGFGAALGRASKRLSWGMGQVGVTRTATGLLRLTALAVRRPDRGHILTSRDHLHISFYYPSQLIPTLIVFQDLMEPELAILSSVLGPGRVAIDVGASIGTWAMSAARTGATVHSCEPDGLNLEMLQMNVRANGMPDRVTTYQIAFGEHEGRANLIPHGRRYLNKIAAAPGARGDIPVTTVDSFVDGLNIDEVDLLKVNTAGAEHAVMLGAFGLFRSRRVRIAKVLDGLEVRPFLDELRSESYDIGVYDGSIRRFVSVPHSCDLDAARPSPMNRYVLVRRSDVTLDLGKSGG